MSDINFTIRKVFPGTDAQKNVGIFATFNMTIDGPDGIIASVNDMKLMRTKDGNKYYVESPFRTYDGKDKEGNLKKQKVNYIKFFPEEKNWDKQDAIVRLVMAELTEAPPKPAATASKPAASKPAPAKVAPKTNSVEPW